MAKKKSIIVRDAVDIEQIIDSNTVPLDKTSLTDSEEVRYSEIDLRHSNLKIFSLLTTSDKEINVRSYPDEHVQDMIKNHSWTYPYAKPLQTNHDVYGECNARFMDAWYLKHDDLKPQYGFGKLPQKVIDEFEKRDAFKEGTGSAIGMAETSNKDFKIKIINGTFLTTSQGASTESLTCNICNDDYRQCKHMRGSTYQIFSEDGKQIVGVKKCVPFTGPLTAIEDSVVNVPANDTSTLLVYDTKKDQIVTMDNISEYSDIFEIKDMNIPQNTITDKKIKDNGNRLEDNKVNGLSQEEIEKIKKMLDKGETVPSTVLDSSSKKEETNKDIPKIKDNENQLGGNTMSKSFKNSTAKRIFRDDLNRLEVKDNGKIDEFFESLSDEQLDIAMSILDFVNENKEISSEQTNDSQGTEEAKPTGEETKSTGEQTNDSEIQKKLTDTEEEYQKALKMICDLKGINNEVPSLADLQKIIDEQENKDKEIKDGITDFGF